VDAAGGWETWSWDESLFAGSAAYYERGRLPYAPGLADVFGRSLALDGRGRLLDAGCGPGTVTLRLAPLFEAVIGLDPDPDMLAFASRAAAREGVVNAGWVLREILAQASPPGRFCVRLPDNILRIWRRAALTAPGPAGSDLSLASPGR
jgi:SAM-dependent methyltransferase